jgi:hypothetical protein
MTSLKKEKQVLTNIFTFLQRGLSRLIKGYRLIAFFKAENLIQKCYANSELYI